MNVEQMTNEELAHELLSGDWTGHAKDLTDEAARRLRNSIPKLDMTIEQGDIMYINGTYIGIVDEQCITNVRKALGLEGGGDAD